MIPEVWSIAVVSLCLHSQTLDFSLNVAVAVTLLGIAWFYDLDSVDRKSTRLNSSHSQQSRMPSSA